MKSVVSIFVLMVTIFSSHAMAESGDFYAGAFLGVSEPEESVLDDDKGYRVTGGVMISDYVALEASYLDLGQFDFEGSALPVLSAVATQVLGQTVTVTSADIEVSGMELSMVGMVPLSEQVSLFGRVGAFFWDADYNFDTLQFGSEQDSDDGTDVSFGAGLKFKINRSAAVSVEYNAYEASDLDYDLYGVGINMMF